MPAPVPSTAAVRGGSGAMFDGIARRYDLLNRVTSLGLDVRWRKRLVNAIAPQRLPAGSVVLDVATGTADVALSLLDAAPHVQVVGVDPSVQMLAIGRDKWAAKAPPGRDQQLILREGTAEAPPPVEGGYAGATMAFGIRNVVDRMDALFALQRVLAPGATLAILELTEPARGPLAALARFWVHVVVPLLGASISGRAAYRYLSQSIAAFPAGAAFAEEMRAARYTDVQAHRLSFGAAHLFVGRVPQRAAR